MRTRKRPPGSEGGDSDCTRRGIRHRSIRRIRCLVIRRMVIIDCDFAATTPQSPRSPSRLACRLRVTHFAPSLLSSGGAIFLPVLPVPSHRVGRRGGERILPCSPFRAYRLGAAGEGEYLVDELVVGDSLGSVDCRPAPRVVVPCVIADGLVNLEFHLLATVSDVEAGA